MSQNPIRSPWLILSITTLILCWTALCAPQGAFAETVFPCSLYAESKSNPKDIRNDSFILLKSRTNRIQLVFNDSTKTQLDLRVEPDGKLAGFVNGQYLFRIEGNVHSGGLFESASARGTLVCDPAVQFASVFEFKPWGRWFAPEFDSILRAAKMDSYGYFCFIGDVNDAAERLIHQPNPEWKSSDLLISNSSSNPRDHGIRATRTETRCISQPYPDADCLAWGQPSAFTYELNHCDRHQVDYP